MDVNGTVLNANSSNETFSVPVFPAYIRPAATVLCSIVMGIGILGNVMVLLVIFKSKDMRSSTNIFLMNLSVADLMVLLICTPTALVEVHSKPETWVLGEEMCKAVPFIETTVSHASVLTILAISFERYYAICEPLKAGYVCTKARAFLICVCAWAVAAVLTSPLLMIPEYGPKEYIDGTTVNTCLLLVNTLWSQLFFYISTSLFFWIPFVVLVFLYSVIAFRLMADPGIKGSETFNYRTRRQLVLMLGTVVILFFLCLMPFRVFILWHIAVPGSAIQALGVENYFNILYFCRIMFYVNSAVNPILYNLMSSKFRDRFSRLCSLHSDKYFIRRRRWEMTASMYTATSSLSTSSRREWENRLARNKALTRNLPYTRRLDDFSPILHRAYVSQTSQDDQSIDRISIYKYIPNGSRSSAAISEYDNVEDGRELLRSKSETDFTSLVNSKIELKPPERDKDEVCELPLEIYPTDGDITPFKYKESIRRTMMKSKMNKKINGSDVIKLPNNICENGVPIIMLTQFFYDEENDPICVTSAFTVWGEMFFLGTTFIFFALPLIILVVLYSIIATNLMTSPGVVPVTRQDSSTSALRYRKQVVMMIFTVVVFFFMCMLPFRALVVYVVVAPHEQIGEVLGNEGYFPLLYFCRIMFYVNSAVNPILYNLMSSKFRSGFLKLCGLKTNCLRKHTRAILRTSTFNTSTLTTITNSSIHGASIFDTLNRSKPTSFNKRSSSKSSRHSSSCKLLPSKENPPKCHFKLKPVIISHRGSFNEIRNKRNLLPLIRSQSSDSFFKAVRSQTKTSIKFINKDDLSISKPIVNGINGLHQCHSILKKHNKSSNVIVRRQSEDDDSFINYKLIPGCVYAFKKKDLKESFV